MSDLMQRVDVALDDADGDLLKRRIESWKLRLLGYSYVAIANELDISIGTAHGDIRWCHEHLPIAFESAQDFRHIALERLESWTMALADSCVRGEEGSIRASNFLLDMQAKLLGAYAPSKIDATVHTQYEIIGVKTEDL